MRKDSSSSCALILVLGAALSCHAQQSVQDLQGATASGSGFETPWIARIENKDGIIIFKGALVTSKHVLVNAWENNWELKVGNLKAIIGSNSIDVVEGPWNYDNAGYFLLTLEHEVDVTPACVLVTSKEQLEFGPDVVVTGWKNTKELEITVLKTSEDKGSIFYVPPGENFDPALTLDKCADQYMVSGFYHYKTPTTDVFHRILPETKKWLDGWFEQGSQPKPKKHCSVFCLNRNPWVARITGKDGGDLLRWDVSPLAGALVGSKHVLVMTWGSKKIRDRMTADNLQVFLGFRKVPVYVNEIQWFDTGKEDKPYAILTLESTMTDIPAANILKTNEVLEMLSLGDPVAVLAWNEENQLTAHPGKFWKPHNEIITVTMSEEIPNLGLALVEKEGTVWLAGFYVNYNGTLVHNFLTFSPRIEGEVKEILQKAKG